MPGTKGFRYVYASTQITNVLEKIRTTGRPDKLTFPYLRDTWLIKNKQYSDVLVLLKDMEFLDNNGVPTALYGKYQNSAIAKNALARGIRNAYPELFKAFPNAHSLTRGDLEGYFRQQTGKAGSVLGKMLATFQTLCSITDFPDVEVEKEVVVEEPIHDHKQESVPKSKARVEPGIQLHIEIHIAADTPDDKIEAIFKNMKTYLLPNA